MSIPSQRLFSVSRGFPVVLVLWAISASGTVSAQRQAPIKAVARPGATPPWTKGIIPINQESYWNAVACGKQGGQDPPCVFFDTGLCKNDDFALALFTPYKFVAYEVWRVVQQKQPAPTPNYAEAQRTRITVGVTPVPGSKNPFTTLVLKRGGREVAPVDRSSTGTGGRFTFVLPGVCGDRRDQPRSGRQGQDDRVHHRPGGDEDFPLGMRPERADEGPQRPDPGEDQPTGQNHHRPQSPGTCREQPPAFYFEPSGPWTRITRLDWTKHDSRAVVRVATQ